MVVNKQIWRAGHQGIKRPIICEGISSTRGKTAEPVYRLQYKNPGSQNDSGSRHRGIFKPWKMKSTKTFQYQDNRKVFTFEAGDPGLHIETDL